MRPSRTDLLHLNSASGHHWKQDVSRMIHGGKNISPCVALLCLYVGHTRCSGGLVLLYKTFAHDAAS